MPTKINGQRTRNFPYHDPEKWAAFKRYNIRDVETEMSVQARLQKFPVPDFIWEEYHIDQEINDRGVAIDLPLVRQAIVMDARSRSGLTDAMKRITDLDNPNSVQQMKQWLSALFAPAIMTAWRCSMRMCPILYLSSSAQPLFQRMAIS